MRQKESYTLDELYDNLAITTTELSKIASMTEVTLRRIRYGFPTRRSTANKLLLAFTKVYERELSLENVTGFNLEDRRGPLTKGKNVTEKGKRKSVLPEVRQAKVIDEQAEKRPYNRTEKYSGLPDGCILASKFAANHGIARPTFIDHMTKGLGAGKDRVDYSERDKPNRPIEKEKYLTVDQQEQALGFWEHHKVKFVLCKDASCICHELFEMK